MNNEINLELLSILVSSASIVVSAVLTGFIIWLNWKQGKRQDIMQKANLKISLYDRYANIYDLYKKAWAIMVGLPFNYRNIVHDRRVCFQVMESYNNLLNQLLNLSVNTLFNEKISEILNEFNFNFKIYSEGINQFMNIIINLSEEDWQNMISHYETKNDLFSYVSEVLNNEDLKIVRRRMYDNVKRMDNIIRKTNILDSLKDYINLDNLKGYL